MTWAAVPSAEFYDVAKGSLLALRSSAGDFAASLLGCVEDDSLDAGATDSTRPSLGDGFYYLVRANVACRSGTYNSGHPRQQGDRDPEIAASPGACP